MTGGAPYRYRFTIEGKYSHDEYIEAAVEAGFYGVDDDPVHPAFTVDNEVWRAWKDSTS